MLGQYSTSRDEYPELFKTDFSVTSQGSSYDRKQRKVRDMNRVESQNLLSGWPDCALRLVPQLPVPQRQGEVWAAVEDIAGYITVDSITLFADADWKLGIGCKVLK